MERLVEVDETGRRECRRGAYSCGSRMAGSESCFCVGTWVLDWFVCGAAAFASWMVCVWRGAGLGWDQI